MNGIFTSPSRPFYQSVTIINLHPLDLKVYTDFAVKKFEENGKHLERKVVSDIYERFSGVTSYMHRILNVLFSRTEKEGTCTVSMVDEAIEFILKLSSDTYEALLYQMPDKQEDVFLAIARDGNAKEVTGIRFLKRHKLPSASSVSSAIKGLLDRDFITYEKGAYSPYDKFFALWLKYKGII